MTGKERSSHEEAGSRVEMASTPAEAVEAITGRRPDDTTLSELKWYQAVRDRLRHVRNDADLSQQALAGKLGVQQSEVSRIENSLGPGTRLGKLRAYAAACGAQVGVAIVATKDRRALLRQNRAGKPQSGSVPGWAPARVSVDSVRFREQDLAVVSEALPALEEAMFSCSLETKTALALRHRFLEQLARRRGSANAPLLGEVGGGSWGSEFLEVPGESGPTGRIVSKESEDDQPEQDRPTPSTASSDADLDRLLSGLGAIAESGDT